MSAGEIAATMAVFELPPRFSLSSQVNTESRYGMKSDFFFFLPDACCKKWREYLNFLSGTKKLKLTGTKFIYRCLFGPHDLVLVITDLFYENMFDLLIVVF